MLNRNAFETIGFVQDVEVTAKDGRKRAYVKIRTHKDWTKDDEKKSRADFHRWVTFYPRLIELIEKHVRKDQYLCVRGAMRSDSFQTKDGTTVFAYEPFMETIAFLERKPAAETASQ